MSVLREDRVIDEGLRCAHCGAEVSIIGGIRVSNGGEPCTKGVLNVSKMCVHAMSVRNVG